MRSFTNKEKLKAIELYIKYDFRPGAVIYGNVQSLGSGTMGVTNKIIV